MCKKGNNNYWLTLVVPTYNCEKYLDETLGSVLGQLPEDAELIIVDDGSTDGTVKRLAALSNDPKGNVRILLREHGGVSVARNAGLDAASGEWIAFMDCDDCLGDGFFEKSRELIRDNVDLYIFSFERVELIHDGVGFAESATPMTVDDRFYATASDFADEYIRSRHLLVYSACNKFYRRRMINEHHIRFQKGLEFGEDRLFNYDYLEFCGSIVTSRLEMFRYMQRNADSASNKVLPNHRETVMKLHEAKKKCFTGLSKGTTESEKMEFIEYDLTTEIKRMEEKVKGQYRDVAPAVDYHDYIGKRVHLIGIGGASMSGIAIILQKKGCVVSGSDMLDGEMLDALRERGVKIMVGHDEKNLVGVDFAVYSMAIPESNTELAFCRKNGIPAIERSVLLGQLSADYGRSIAVCGTHGKTTVTSMLAQILIGTGADPTVHIGGVLNSIGGGVRMGGSEVFLTEACEYRRNFMNIHPTDIVLLNIDEDHLDYYRKVEEIEEAFGDFLGKLPPDGWALINGDDVRAMSQVGRARCDTSTFGTSQKCDYVMTKMTEDEIGLFSFDISYKGSIIGHVDMSIPGDFNAMNALAALALTHHLGFDMKTACSIVGRFPGVHRRFEQTGTLNKAEVFHDYGHNPIEMHNAISIARKRCRKGRLWAVMQPHTYSRVKALFEDYLDCTEEADVTLVTDIFAAREVDPGDIRSEMLVDAMKDRGIDARLTPTFDDVAKVLREEVKEGDCVITMGCGDIYKLNNMLREE